MLDDTLIVAIRDLGPKPDEDAPQKLKKRYSEKLSAQIALTIAHELRRRGLADARPAAPGEVDAGSGAERRMAGGISAKKVDVTWATPESGLLLGIPLKTFNARDQKTGNFQKNLTNRRGDVGGRGATAGHLCRA